ncbi:Ger(x)C family spore germination protein [Paenibacillus oralis]|uniref:Ger(X)C family spore germination protein n=1 Tax=Paenibacillus oralis TaxID=2490856 RepID=A0A3P3UC41_9BACL|nr:Ger(x)C family spore germination protein [Paenibacillus oralis]RRJ67099.1 Ger(x)C family spore germination protein [Paenibacillus oralis]
MRKIAVAGCLIICVLLLPGCWDKAELTDRSFILGLAIDKADNGMVDLTVQIYKPIHSGGSEGKQGGGDISYINVQTKGETMFDGIRDITLHVGRKGQWSHLKAIIVEDQVVQIYPVGDVLDFFYRDHEARLSSSFFISQGKAAQYLEIKPLIEKTVSQQLIQITEYSNRHNYKTTDTSLLDLFLGLRSQTGISLVPYITKKDGEKGAELMANGMAVLKKGKWQGIVSPQDTRMIHMLLNQYKGGIIRVPCETGSDSKGARDNSLEVLSFHSKLKPQIEGETVNLQVFVQFSGAMGEMKCTKLKTPEDEKKFAAAAAQTVEESLRKTLNQMKQKKLDLIGLGDRIYRKDPALWKRWKRNWEERFADTQFDVKVKVEIKNSGTAIPKPLSTDK